ELLARLVAMQHAGFGAFLEVEDELHRDAGVAGPVGVRRVAPVADEVAGIAGVGHGAGSPGTSSTGGGSGAGGATRGTRIRRQCPPVVHAFTAHLNHPSTAMAS